MSVAIAFLICFLARFSLGSPLALGNITMGSGNATERTKTIHTDWLLNNTAGKDVQNGLEPAPGSTLSTGSIVGIALGSVLILLTVGLLFWCGCQQRYPGVTRRRRRSRSRRRG
jgi:hypothetical protein